MRHAVIMAGGSGTRLWPLSRRLRPKQLLKLFDGKSLLQLARERLGANAEHAALGDSAALVDAAPLFDPGNIWVITSAAYIDQVAAALPDVPRENLIGEPMGRDTANAIGLAAHLLARRDADATMAVFTADHVIRPQAPFAAAIRAGLAAAEAQAGALVTFGIKPRYAATGYGYVRRGTRVQVSNAAAGASVGTKADVNGSAPAPDPPVFFVAEFKEKPTADVAESYVRSGEYYWNSGMFAWRIAAILSELERHLPENARRLAALAADWDGLQGTPEAARRFEQLPRISIDFGVMERAARVLVVELDCEWHDVGSWNSIAGLHPRDDGGNAAISSPLMPVEATGNIVAGEADHLVVLLGVQDLVVIHSADATLVCRRDEVERIRELSAELRQRFGARFE